MQFGCKISSYDSRDFKLTKAAASSPLPKEYSCPLKMPVKNQYYVSSCVAHAMSSILEYHAIPQKKLSTNFIYGLQKRLFNREGEGMMLRDACKIAADYGDALLEDCPGNYEVPNCYRNAEKAFDDTEKLARAGEYRILKYFLCTSNKDIKHAIYNYGPVLGAIRWYDNFSIDKDGKVVGEQKGDYGNHAIVIYGYTEEGFWCQNSWGTDWGKEGRFFLPNSVKIREARGLVDWNGTDELKEPNTNGIWNLIYKGINAIINLFTRLFNK
jgi:C1A family cysteine protease